MKFEKVLEIANREPVISTGLLLAGDVDPAVLQAQLSRWVAEGRLIRLRRGKYVVAPSWAGPEPHGFALANAIRPDSYVSCQSALSWYGLIPEQAPSVVSVAGGRTETVDTPLGSFIYRHLKPSLLWGWTDEDLPGQGEARVAEPEKALLDLAYLTPGADSSAYMEGLRLQSTEQLDMSRLMAMARRWGKPKVVRAARAAAEAARGERQ